jgi:hypothetical protein
MVVAIAVPFYGEMHLGAKKIGDLVQTLERNV